MRIAKFRCVIEQRSAVEWSTIIDWSNIMQWNSVMVWYSVIEWSSLIKWSNITTWSIVMALSNVVDWTSYRAELVSSHHQVLLINSCMFVACIGVINIKRYPQDIWTYHSNLWINIVMHHFANDVAQKQSICCIILCPIYVRDFFFHSFWTLKFVVRFVFINVAVFFLRVLIFCHRSLCLALCMN